MDQNCFTIFREFTADVTFLYLKHVLYKFRWFVCSNFSDARCKIGVFQLVLCIIEYPISIYSIKCTKLGFRTSLKRSLEQKLVFSYSIPCH